MEDNIQLGLMGYPLGHSYSRLLHERALQELGKTGQYILWEIPPGEDAGTLLKKRISALRKGDVQGINITLPYKEQITPYLDSITRTAERIGAVNTIYWDPAEKQAVGDNTDAPAFWKDLKLFLPEGEKPGSALVLGAGGAARAVCCQLLDRGWHVLAAARRFDQAQALIQDLGSDSAGKAAPLSLLDADLPANADLQLIVNATSAGMYPNPRQSPWPAGWQLPASAAVYDLVYNPPLTAFLRQAQQAGLRTMNGLGMLVEQAALAFESWLGCPAPREAMRKAVLDQSNKNTCSPE